MQVLRYLICFGKAEVIQYSTPIHDINDIDIIAPSSQSYFVLGSSNLPSIKICLSNLSAGIL